MGRTPYKWTELISLMCCLNHQGNEENKAVYIYLCTYNINSMYLYSALSCITQSDLLLALTRRVTHQYVVEDLNLLITSPSM